MIALSYSSPINDNNLREMFWRVEMAPVVSVYQDVEILWSYYLVG